MGAAARQGLRVGVGDDEALVAAREHLASGQALHGECRGSPSAATQTLQAILDSLASSVSTAKSAFEADNTATGSRAETAFRGSTPTNHSRSTCSAAWRVQHKSFRPTLGALAAGSGTCFFAPKLVLITRKETKG